MANWKFEIDLSSAWQSEDPKLIAAEVVRRIEALDLSPLNSLHRQMIEELREEFRSLSEEESPDEDDFDDLMSALYDWGDRSVGPRTGILAQKLCWVRTC